MELAALPLVVLLLSPDEASERALRAEIDAAQHELAATEIRLESFKRVLPYGFDAAEERAALEKAAGAAEMEGLRLKPLPDLERGPASLGGRLEVHRLEASGRDRPADVLMFLQLATRRSRLVALEGLRLTAAPRGEVAFSVRLVLPALAPSDAPSRPAAPPRMPATAGLTPEQARDAARAAVLTARLADLRQRQAEVDALAAALAALSERARSAHAVDGLAVFAHEVDGDPAALTEIAVDDEVVVRGVALGSATADGVRARLEKAGFQVGALTRSPAGPCQAFTLKARFQGGEVPVEIARDVFDDRTDVVCRARPATRLGRVVARGSASGPATRALRLRDADVGDVFRALHELTSESFVLDTTLAGRLDVDVEGATTDEVLAAVRAAGLAVGPGPLRRVSPGAAGSAPAPTDDYTGETVSVSLKEARLPDVICLFHNITGLPILVPGDVAARVSVFARDVAWDRQLAAIVASAGLARVIDGDRLFVGTPAQLAAAGRPGFGDACERSAEGGRSWADRFSRPETVAVEDLALAGVARTAKGWTAYAYAPTRTMFALEKGDAVKGARVAAVGPTGVTFETDGKRTIEVPFRP